CSALPIPGHARVVEVPIRDNDVPNRFVGGTVVHEGVVHTENCQLIVPPVRDLLTVEVAAEKRVQRPGEPGKFQIKVTDAEGQPVSGDLALAAFDKAVTYIAQESALGPKAFVTSRKGDPWHWTGSISATLDPRR